MKIYLALDRNANKGGIIKEVSKFRDVSRVYDAGENVVVHLKKFVAQDQEQKIKNLQKKYGMAGVKKVIVTVANDKSTLGIRDKSLHCFFDIDGTLTRGSGIINRKIRTIFGRMKKDGGMRIYFASGRSMPCLEKDMTSFQTEPYGISENGGIIMGLGNRETLGDRTQPDVLHSYIRSNCRKAREDIDQGFRRTERIYLQKSISRKQMNEYVKKSGAKVDIHPSRNSYHVSAKGINKGAAIEKFSTEMRFGPDNFIVAIGDADMDVPMLKASDLGFAVGNASPAVIKEADIALTGEHEKGIAEMYESLLKISGLSHV